jgi:hypothetical protein
MVMMSELMGLIFPGKRAWRAAESCGNSFRCGASLKDCWCFHVKLKPEAREELRGKYKYCLCAECLAPFTVNQTTESEQSKGVSQ